MKAIRKHKFQRRIYRDVHQKSCSMIPDLDEDVLETSDLVPVKFFDKGEDFTARKTLTT